MTNFQVSICEFLQHYCYIIKSIVTNQSIVKSDSHLHLLTLSLTNLVL